MKIYLIFYYMRRIMDHYCHFVWCCVLIFSFNHCSSQPRNPFEASPQNAAIILGGNVTIELFSSESQYDSISKCRVTSPLNILNITLLVNAPYQEYKLTSNAPDTVHYVGNKRCRFTVTSMSSKSDGSWKIEFLSGEGQWGKISSEITLMPKPKSEQTLQAAIGASAQFDCGDSSFSKVIFCSIFSNSGELYSSECIFKLDPVKLDHIGDWTCAMYIVGSMDLVNHTIHLVESAREGVYSSVEIEESSLILKCTLLKSTLQINWCRAISPTGNTFILNGGLTSGRYSSKNIMKSADNVTCILRIELPLDISLEYGQWRIDMGKTIDDFTGCFINLPNNTHITLPPDNGLRPVTSSMVKSGSSLCVRCEVPWPAAYCYVRRPNGEFVKPDGLAIQRLMQVGICQLTVNNVTIDGVGRWTCGLSSNDGTEDKLFYTDVTVITQTLYSVERVLTPGWGEGVFLLCRSVEKRPLRYCRFTSPVGKGYFFKPNITSDARLSYWGTGLDSGECGLRIREIKSDDVGDWTCAVTFNSYSVENFAIITLAKPVPPVAFTVGMSFTAIIICSILIALGCVIYRKKIARTPIVSETTRLSRSSISPEPLICNRQSDYYPLFSQDSASVATLRSISGRSYDQ